ncbi:MAG TPA: gamma carbonic anhydrase family protein [Candidatus Limnocylindrales bacterium]|nr:gamma carbonic anhydrase family protein [Candidatus Limnocylindrales bacterium]
MIRSYDNLAPRIAFSAWVAPTAVVVGDVEIGEDSSIWYGCVVRGDVFHVRIGARTNVQDMTVIHVTHERYPTILHDDITVGHRAVLHGCTVESRALIGIGAVVLDQAVIGEGALVAAGSLVTPSTRVPCGMMVMGAPARVVREVTDAERAWMAESSRNYVEYARRHAAAG